MPVIISAAAEADLEEIGDFIAASSPVRAVSFIAELRGHCQKIAAAPMGYPSRSGLVEDLRLCVHEKYLIFFRVLEKEVRIERILHGARDIERLLEE
ncbi:MAG: type II toxin-antitoxin system RelE/ParE family toxin [Pseudomonadota bacterium]